MEIPFVGGSYEGKSKNLNAQVCQNLYPVVDQQGGKSVLGLYNVPGTAAWINLGEGNRYLVKLNSSLYFNKNKDILTIPQLGYLIGWYKFNEGSGTVVNNYATGGSSGGGLLPNLTVINNGGQFWSYGAGFASNGCGSSISTISSYHTEYAYADLPVQRSYGGSTNGYAAFGIFARRSSLVPLITGAYLSNMMQKNKYDTLISNAAMVFSGFGWPNTGGSNWTGSVSKPAGTPIAKESWVFMFQNGSFPVRVVKNDGTIVYGSSSLNVDAVILLNYLKAGVQSDSSTGSPSGSGYGHPRGFSSYADWIIYNFTTLTDAQWAQWYDQLRGRYGMSARNGW